jgi:hypothetical protein
VAFPGGNLFGGEIAVHKPCGFEIVPPRSTRLDGIMDIGIILTGLLEIVGDEIDHGTVLSA